MLYDGDILLPKSGVLTQQRQGFSINSSNILNNKIWPNATMYYVVDKALPNPERITAAIAHYAANAPFLKFVPRTNQANYVTITRASGTASSSEIGMKGGQQYLRYADAGRLGNLLHEMGHAWGLWHEHLRQDRDQYIKVYYENMVSLGFLGWITPSTLTAVKQGAYDYDSVMHYSAYSASSNGKPTMTRLDGSTKLGGSKLTAGDIQALKNLYSK